MDVLDARLRGVVRQEGRDTFHLLPFQRLARGCLPLAVAVALAAAGPAGAQQTVGPVTASAGTSAPAPASADSSTLDDTIRDVKRLRDQRRWLEALSLIERAETRWPGDGSLHVLRIHTLTELGARYQAWTLFVQRPDGFTPQEKERLEADYLARMVSWGRVYPELESQRRAQPERAQRAVDEAVDGQAVPARVRFDRLELWKQLGRYQDVIRDYEAMRAAGISIPAYALPPVGDAYMAAKRPEDAARVIRAALKADPDNAELQIQLAYAQLEAEHFDLALPALRKLAESQRAWPYTAGAKAPYENWKRYDYEFNYALIRSYAEDLRGSQGMLETLSAVGPANPGLQTSLGSVYSRRGWESRALERYSMAITLDPRNIGGRIGAIESLVALNRADEARPIHADLLRVEADNPQVQRMHTIWKVYQGWQAYGWASTGRSSRDASTNGGFSPFAARELAHGLEVESPLLQDHWRLTAGWRESSADFQGRTLVDRRGIAGLRYFRGDFSAHLRALPVWGGVGRNGASLDLGWRFNDVLRGRTTFTLNDPSASLQARAAGIQADSITLGMAWQPSELTHLDADASHWRYADGNRRNSLSVAIDQRLLTRPHLFVNGLGGVYLGSGSRTDAPYYNPSRDAALNVGLRADHLIWRRYDRWMRQRLTVQASNVWQQGYGSAWVPMVRYEHEWKLGVGWRIGYGANWSRPVYDGNRERHVAFDAFLRLGEW